MGTTSTVSIPVERQKAAQAAGRFELADLPARLAEAPAAVRLGRSSRSDEALVGVSSAAELTALAAGQVLASYGRAESTWVVEHARRRVGKAQFPELLSYARQLVGLGADGHTRICLMGHAGRGPCVPLWIVEDEVTLTVQPGDVLLRFDDQQFDA